MWGLRLEAHGLSLRFVLTSSCVVPCLVTQCDSNIIAVWTFSHCQKLRLKIKRLAVSPVLDDVNHLTDIWLQILCQQMYGIERDFVTFWVFLFFCVCCPSAIFKWWWWHPLVCCHGRAFIYLVLSSVSSLYPFGMNATSCQPCSRPSSIRHPYLLPQLSKRI